MEESAERLNRKEKFWVLTKFQRSTQGTEVGMEDEHLLARAWGETRDILKEDK